MQMIKVSLCNFAKFLLLIHHRCNDTGQIPKQKIAVLRLHLPKNIAQLVETRSDALWLNKSAVSVAALSLKRARFYQHFLMREKKR